MRSCRVYTVRNSCNKSYVRILNLPWMHSTDPLLDVDKCLFISAVKIITFSSWNNLIKTRVWPLSGKLSIALTIEYQLSHCTGSADIYMQTNKEWECEYLSWKLGQTSIYQLEGMLSSMDQHTFFKGWVQGEVEKIAGCFGSNKVHFVP